MTKPSNAKEKISADDAARKIARIFVSKRYNKPGSLARFTNNDIKNAKRRFLTLLANRGVSHSIRAAATNLHPWLKQSPNKNSNAQRNVRADIARALRHTHQRYVTNTTTMGFHGQNAVPMPVHRHVPKPERTWNNELNGLADLFSKMKAPERGNINKRKNKSASSRPERGNINKRMLSINNRNDIVTLYHDSLQDPFPHNESVTGLEVNFTDITWWHTNPLWYYTLDDRPKMSRFRLIISKSSLKRALSKPWHTHVSNRDERFTLPIAVKQYDQGGILPTTPTDNNNNMHNNEKRYTSDYFDAFKSRTADYGTLIMPPISVRVLRRNLISRQTFKKKLNGVVPVYTVIPVRGLQTGLKEAALSLAEV
jgi:hypothetical protein